MPYLWLKFFHLVFVVAWIGAVTALTAFNLLLLSTIDRHFLRSLLRYSGAMGGLLIGPAAGLVLLTGLAMVWVGHTGFPLWIMWGIVTIIVAVTVGGIVFRRAAMQFARLLGQPDASDDAIAAGQRRMALQGLTMVLLLVLAVWAMVFKPS